LISAGNGRGTKYHINESEGQVDSSENNMKSSGTKVGTSENNIESSGTKVGTSENNIESSDTKVGTLENNIESSGTKVGTSENNIENSGTKVGTSKRLKFEELQSIIMSIAEDYITINEIAKKVDRTIDYIANKIIPKMIKNGTIEHLYPGIPNHPKQKYKATNKRTNN